MQVSYTTIIAVGIGGFLGAIARFYITHWSGAYLPHTIPFGTSIVNIVGSFIIGCLFALFSMYSIEPYIKSFLTTGFLGALTTFSTFAMESFFLLNTNIYYAFVNIALNLFGSIIAAGVGFKLLSHLIR